MLDMDWKEYIGNCFVPFRADLKLFPDIWDEFDGMEECLLKDRFRWLLKAYPTCSPNKMYEVWKNPILHLEEEKFEFSGTQMEFNRISEVLPVLMAKKEALNLQYYRDLHSCLSLLPVRDGYPSLIVGPTFGGELEVVENVGSTPFIPTGESVWSRIVEERLTHDGIKFGDFGVKSNGRFKFNVIILSDMVSLHREAMEACYDLLGEFGFIIFQGNTISLKIEAEKLNLTKRFSYLRDISVYYKNIGLPLFAKDI